MRHQQRFFMKAIITTFLLLMLFAGAKAQDGILLAATYLDANQVYYPQGTQKMLERTNSVKLIGTDCKQVFSEKNAYGYRVNNRTWRFYEEKSYEIIAQEGIYIYRLAIDSQTSCDLYFFSKTSDGSLLPLNRKNLKKVYHDNPMLLEMLSVLPWRFHLEDPIPPFNKLRIEELYLYTIAN